MVGLSQVCNMANERLLPMHVFMKNENPNNFMNQPAITRLSSWFVQYGVTKFELVLKLEGSFTIASFRPGISKPFDALHQKSWDICQNIM
jgi:hypothetical protein